ncbi:M50 family metallopeptidase [Aquimarina sp. MMG016]|uniref:M50 family metallopeptidase n=1 Tax=Aquimarina sp. MMG016 TaxID=2822690 RepID=UPI001B3A3210|nr:M50 family metallopeptidase [Aquimarina sp. MMG016]MBQ4819893.1 M50 family metallopeptidase [Aquimarina sp. MMG016]
MKHQPLFTIIGISLLVFLLWQLPYFGMVQYPLLLLGTWFHEMGHGLTALLLGGKFYYLEIYDNGGGVAYSNVATSYLEYPYARAITSAGGLLGPAISGAILIAAARNKVTSKIVLWLLIAIMVLSLCLWIHELLALVILSVFAAILFFIAILRVRNLEAFTLLFLGTQCVLSTYLQTGYLFTKQFERDGRIQYSDTQMIAAHLSGTYWMWAILILLITVYLLYKSYRYYLKK